MENRHIIVKLACVCLFFLCFSKANGQINYINLHTQQSFDNYTIDQSKPVGVIPGQAGVSEGSASYTMPLYIPPGTNGMQPNVSVTYSSMGGSGIMGKGWNLVGLSSISVVGKNIFHDGEVTPVALDASDHFALDGQRLLLKSGTYGANGATYGKELEDFSTVTSYNVINGQPEYFILESKTGVKMEYGRQNNSKLKSNDGSRTISYFLNKVIDLNGNYTKYIYQTIDNSIRIDEIQYTGNDGESLSPYNKIEFYYDERIDKNTIYIAANPLNQKYLLTKISVKAGSDKVQDYEFKYGNNDITSFLTEIHFKGGYGSYLNKTIFKYGDESDLDSDDDFILPHNNHDENLFFGDFNGDGRSDVLAMENYGNSRIETDFREFKIFSAPYGSSTFSQKYWESGLLNGRASKLDIGEYNTAFFNSEFTGDGLEDVLINFTKDLIGDQSGDQQYRYKLNKTRIYKSALTNSSSSNLSFTKKNIGTPRIDGVRFNRFAAAHWGENGRFHFQGDFDGDGAQDYLHIISNGIGFKTFLNLPRKNKFKQEIKNIQDPNGYNPYNWVHCHAYRTLDFDGDGKDEILLVRGAESEIYTFEEVNGVWEARRLYASGGETYGYPNQFHLIYVGDFNGDGKGDLLTRGSRTNTNADWEIAYSDGEKFIQEDFNSFNPLPEINLENDSYDLTDDALAISDVDANGQADIIYVPYGENETTLVYLTRGKDRFRKVTSIQDFDPRFLGVADLNGDGFLDLVDALHEGGTLHENGNSSPINDPVDVINFYKDSKHLLLENIKDGFGGKTEFEYHSLAEEQIGDYTFYSKTASTQHPINTLGVPINNVFKLREDDGIGGQTEKVFEYKDLKLNKEGKGMLGFNELKVHNITNHNYSHSTKKAYYNGYLMPEYTYTYQDDGINNPVLLNTNRNIYQTPVLATGQRWIRLYKNYNTNHFEGRYTYRLLTYDPYGNTTKDKTNYYHIVNGSNVIKHYNQVVANYIQSGTPMPALPDLVTKTSKRYGAGNGTYSVKTKHSYDTKARPIWKQAFYGKAKAVLTEPQYDGYGNVVYSKTSAAGLSDREVWFEYDNRGQFLEWKKNVLNQYEYFDYHLKWGKITHHEGIDGLEMEIEYDEFGRLKRTTDLDRNVSHNTHYEWNINSATNSVHKVRETNTGVPDETSYYDLLGRVVKTEFEGYQNQWISSNRYYDHRGRLETETSPHKSGESHTTTDYYYDDYNRITSSQNSFFGNHTHTYSYLDGVLTSQTTDPSGRVTSKKTDAVGKTLSSTDNGGTVDYLYHSNGNIRQVLNASTVLVTNLYDVYGRQTRMTDINAGVIKYYYDAYGQLYRQISANNKNQYFYYDNLGRMDYKTMPEGTVDYIYYGSGNGAATNMIKKVDNIAYGNFEEYEFDNLGRMSKHKISIDGSTYINDYGYDNFNNLTDEDFDSGFGLHYDYDSNGYLEKIKNANESVTIFENKGMNGLLQYNEFLLGNGRTTDQYFNHGVPYRYSATGSSFRYEMNWDYSIGNLEFREDELINKKEEFSYDNLDRLSSSWGAGISTINLNYSTDGNIMSKGDIGDYTYGSTKINAVTHVENSSDVILTRQQDISYTSFHQPNEIEEGNLKLVFDYGADEQRIKMTKYDGATEVLKRYYLNGFEKNERNGSTDYIHYISAGENTVAIVRRINGEDEYYYTYTDHLGSILKVTNSTGSTIAEQNFDAWGRKRNPTTWAYTNLPSVPDWLYRGYTMHEELPDFGLINMNGRLYDPAVGRMLSVDNYVQEDIGLSTQAYNRYSYARNNPLKYTDPEGESLFIVPQINFGNGGLQIGAEIGIGVPHIGSVSGTLGYDFGGDKPYWSVQASAFFAYAGYGSNGFFAGVGIHHPSGIGAGYDFVSNTAYLGYGTSHQGFGASASLLYNTKTGQVGISLGMSHTTTLQQRQKASRAPSASNERPGGDSFFENPFQEGPGDPPSDEEIKVALARAWGNGELTRQEYLNAITLVDEGTWGLIKQVLWNNKVDIALTASGAGLVKILAKARVIKNGMLFGSNNYRVQVGNEFRSYYPGKVRGGIQGGTQAWHINFGRKHIFLNPKHWGTMTSNWWKPWK